MATLNWSPYIPLKTALFCSFFLLTNIKHTAASWPLQALMAEVMSETARKSVIAMIVEKLWRMLLSGPICDGWRAETIYWWQRKDPPTSPQSVRNHQCPTVRCHLQLTTSAHSTLAWTGGRGMCTFVFDQVVNLTRSEVKLGMTCSIPERMVAWKLLPVNAAAPSCGYIWMDLQGHSAWLTFPLCWCIQSH